MKCPKCNYTTFDYSQVCPKCGKDNSEEQARLKFSPNKPDPPFFLASLIGMAGSEGHEVAGIGGGAHFSDDAFGEMDTKDLLIALDDLDGDNTSPDAPEMPDPSSDEIVFETGDSREAPLETLDPADDEILFDLEPSSEGIEIENVAGDPLDMQDFISDSPDETQIPIEITEVAEEKPVAQPTKTAAPVDDVDLFLADEPENLDPPAKETAAREINFASEDLDSPELFLSLDDLSDKESKPKPPVSSPPAKDEILFELEETPEPEGESFEIEVADEKDFWNSDKKDKQPADSEPEVIKERKAEASSQKPIDLQEEVNLFSDLDIEPLDLDLSLEDLEKNPE